MMLNLIIWKPKLQATAQPLIMSVIIISISILISACGGGNGDESNVQTESYSSYIEKPGDIFTYQYSGDFSYSNGQTATLVWNQTDTYSQVDSIPAKYSYTGDISGPYILNTTTEDGALDGYEYISSLGTEIVDDNLETFTRIDAKTSAGDEDPENISIGDTYAFSENAILFDSNTGTEVGSEITNGNMSVIEKADVSVPAGSFQSIKITYNISSTKTVNSITDTYSMSGSVFYGTDNGADNGYLIKMTGSLNMTLNEYGLTAEGTSEIVLHNFYLGSSAGKTLSKMNLSSINLISLKSIVNDIRRLNRFESNSILDNAQEIL